MLGATLECVTRIRFWALSALAIALSLEAAVSVVVLPAGGSISAVAGLHGVVLLIHGRPKLAARMTLNLDDTVAIARPALHVLGEASPRILILEDSYYSKPGGLSSCKAGKEQFLRVLQLTRPPRQRLRVKLNSCVGNVELDEPGVVWDAGARTIEIRWLTNGAGPTFAKYSISESGETLERARS